MNESGRVSRPKSPKRFNQTLTGLIFYGYIHFEPGNLLTIRDSLPERFPVDIEGVEIRNRHVDPQGRIYVGVKATRILRPNQEISFEASQGRLYIRSISSTER